MFKPKMPLTFTPSFLMFSNLLAQIRGITLYVYTIYLYISIRYLYNFFKKFSGKSQKKYL